MIINNIKLTNFRNHSSYSLNCNQNITLIIGNNGFGKTSILEAIYILMRGKSFRATDPEIIKHESDFYRIELEYDNGETVAASFNGDKKTFLIAGKKSQRIPKKYKYPVVLFLPSDLNLISHSPGRRREYFDRIISQLSEDYGNSLSRYEKALKQRNELLKNEHRSSDALFSWNIILSQYGTKILKQRRDYIEDLNKRITKVYQSIAENQDQVNIKYKTDLPVANDAAYLRQLEYNSTKDYILGHTSFGVHRDDYIFDFNHKIANGSASRGETRSIILALKFIEASQVYQTTNLHPIILLDDVFSELDTLRRRALTKNFKDNQIIITSVEKIDPDF